jgi:hypothetical protein
MGLLTPDEQLFPASQLAARKPAIVVTSASLIVSANGSISSGRSFMVSSRVSFSRRDGRLRVVQIRRPVLPLPSARQHRSNIARRQNS